MTDPERIELPGSALVPALESVSASKGELARLVPVPTAVEVAAATLEAATAGGLGEALHALAGLEGRERPRRSPFALRALLLALEDGHLSYHEDLREPLPLAPDQVSGPLPHRFETFHQEAVVASAPARIGKASKWDVHHLWHTTHGLHWAPGFTRGDLYTGIRLNEAASEAHWYHLDEVLAPRCEAHAKPALAAIGPETWPDCARCDAAAPDRDEATARALVKGGIRFWDSEVATTDLVRVTGRLAPNPLTALVPNWKDAFEYVEAHEPRLRSAPFRAYAARALVLGVDRETELARYRDRIAERVARLLLAPLVLDVARARLRQVRRVLQDVASRVAQASHLGWLPADAIEPIVAALGAVTPLALRTDAVAPEERATAGAAAWTALLGLAAHPGAERVLALGYDLRPVLGSVPEPLLSDARASCPVAKALVRDGVLLATLGRRLEEEVPLTARAARETEGDALGLAHVVAGSASFRAGRLRLGTQAATALAGRPPLGDVAAYEEALVLLPRAHAAFKEDLFALGPEADAAPPEDSHLVRMNPSLTRLELAHDVAAFAAGGALVARLTVVFLGSHGGRALVAEATDLDGLTQSLKVPRPLGVLVGPGGPFEGRRARVLELLARGLLVRVVRPPR